VIVLFRVYDEDEKKWVEDNIYLTPNGDLVMIKKVMGFAKIPIVLDQGRYIYHKMIGLQDVNNTEVYEGDYLLARVEDDREIVGLVTFAEELGSYIILDINDDKYYHLGDTIREFIQIIGNVFDGCEDVSHS
jgi:hypothetical protein